MQLQTFIPSSTGCPITSSNFNHHHSRLLPTSIHPPLLDSSQPQPQPHHKIRPQHNSPRLDALAYVSTSQLPNLSLTPSTSTTTATDPDLENGRVRAYAKLEFPQHDFFIRKLTVTIGRRPPSRPDSEPLEEEQIDVDLGPIRAVSRHHARIYFDWTCGRWTLFVAGRNGCVVDGCWRARGEVLALAPRAKIQIAERIFYFILPQIPSPQQTVQACQPEPEIIPSESDPDTHPDHQLESDDDIDEPRLEPSAPNHDPLLKLTNHPPSPPRLALKLPTRRPTPRPIPKLLIQPPKSPSPKLHGSPSAPQTGPGREPEPETKPKPEEEEEESELSDIDESDSSSQSDQHSLPLNSLPPEFTHPSLSEGSEDEPRPPSPPRRVPIYPGVQPGDGDSDDSDDSDVMLSSEAFADEILLPSKMPKQTTSGKVPKKAWAAFAGRGGKGGKGKMGGRGKGCGGPGKNHGFKAGAGKSGGKMPYPVSSSHLTSSIEQGQSQAHSLEKHSTTNWKGKSSSSSSSSSTGSKVKGQGKDHIPICDGSTGKTVPVVVKERRKIVCVAPTGADIGTETRKPPYTYASFIVQALMAQADEDGKMLVTEICEWIAGVYPFYGAKPKSSDWRSAVRHNLNADKRFTRIERQPTDGGKGNFWTISPEELVNFDGLELRRPKPEPPPRPPPKAASNKPSASIANLARDGIQVAPHRRPRDDDRGLSTIRPGITPNQPPSEPCLPGLSALPAPVAAIAQPVNRLAPRTPVTISTEVGIRPPPPTPVTPSASLLDLGPFSTAACPDRVNPALLVTDPRLSTPNFHDPSLHDSRIQDSHLHDPCLNHPIPSLRPQPQPQPQPHLPVTSNSRQLSNIAFQIVIEPLPPSASPRPISTSTASGPIDELSQMMLRDPPMVSQDHRLILNPNIFGKLTPAQVTKLEKLGSVQAIKILQTYIVEHYKELMKKARRKGKRKNGEEEDQTTDPGKKPRTD